MYPLFFFSHYFKSFVQTWKQLKRKSHLHIRFWSWHSLQRILLKRSDCFHPQWWRYGGLVLADPWNSDWNWEHVLDVFYSRRMWNKNLRIRRLESSAGDYFVKKNGTKFPHNGVRLRTRIKTNRKWLIILAFLLLFFMLKITCICCLSEVVFA